MPRYIDADALIEDLRYDIELDARTLDDLDFADAKGRELVQLDKDIKQNTIRILEQTPTADVVSKEDTINELIKEISDRIIQFLEANYEIVPKKSAVRCKDCVHHKDAPKTTDVWCDRLDGLLPKDWFCADGERGDNGEIH